MTGRIEVLATLDKPGRITTNSGASRFHYAYRLPLGKMDGLTTGRLVTFELEKGSPEMAVGVCPKELSESSPGVQNGRREVRYEGFEQTKNIRTYKFQAWRTGEENQGAVVTVDIALFRRHGIGIQEGPGLCLRFLESELQEPSRGETSAWKWTLGDREMLAYLACRPASNKKRG
jgi:hypothetical protein